jgi:hypothetical protein
VEAMADCRVVDAATGSASYATASLILGTAEVARSATCSGRDRSSVDAFITLVHTGLESIIVCNSERPGSFYGYVCIVARAALLFPANTRQYQSTTYHLGTIK